MRRSRAPSNWPGPFFAARSWAGCTTNMFGFDLRQAQDRYREPFSPISRLLDGGLRHTYAGREQSRGKGIGRGANSAVARPRRSWPTLGGAVWSLASDAKQRCPDIDARL